MNRKFKLLDVVALLKEIPEKNLLAGQVGTIVEELGDGIYEVEFSGRNGETIAMASVKAEDILLLHYELEEA